MNPLRFQMALGGIAATFAVLIGLYFLGSHNGLKAERARMAPVIAGYQLRIDRLVTQLAGLEDDLKNSNAAVDQLKAEADAREKSAAAALKVARTQADRYRLRASQIAAAKPTGDQCEAAATLIRDTLSEDRK